MRSRLRRIILPLIVTTALALSSIATATSTQIDAPQLSLPGLDGSKLNLTNWHDRIVVLVFWATWCTPCISEVPGLVILEKKYRSSGLSIVSVGIDDADKLSNVVRTLDINYPVMVANPDTARLMLDKWGNRKGVIPYTVIIDRTGRVHTTHIGPIYRDDLESLFLPLIATKDVNLEAAK